MDNATNRRIKQERESKDWTQQQLAEKMHLPDASYISKMENGIRKVSPEEIAQLSTIFECSIYYLLGLTNDRTKDTPSQLRLPILGTIRAGVPILAQQSYDGYIEIPDSIRADFALRVIGDSMIGVGIMDGDLALCRESDVPQFGRIIVALRDESSISTATLKFYFNGSGEPKLKAANPVFPDIDYKDGYRCAGIMVALLRQDTTGYQAYQDFLAVSGHEEWTEIIDLAHGAGLKISQVRQILEGQIEIAKRLRE